MTDRYGGDVLGGDWRRPPRGRSVELPAEPGTVVEDVETGWVGAVVRVEKAGGVRVVHLEDRHGRTKGFRLGPGFLVDGAPVTLTPPRAKADAELERARAASARTASGSRAVSGQRARVAIGSRLYVEGKHDAELVEKVWGADLRVEGVVVELLDGVDDLAGAIRDVAPGPGRRMGVLVDHLVPGTKEWRVVQEARAVQPYAAHVLVVGHPYVDVWQSVKPQRLGMDAWPVIPRGTSWKVGIADTPGLAALDPGRPRAGLAPHPGVGRDLRRPRARAARPGRGADRLRHGAGLTEARAAATPRSSHSSSAASAATTWGSTCTHPRLVAPALDHRCHTVLFEQSGLGVGADPHEQPAVAGRAGQGTVDHEPGAAEHPLLLGGRQAVADAVDELHTAQRGTHGVCQPPTSDVIAFPASGPQLPGA